MYTFERNYIPILDNVHLSTLEKRGIIAGALFLFKIINGKVSSLFLLGEINLHPTHTRERPIFLSSITLCTIYAHVPRTRFINQLTVVPISTFSPNTTYSYYTFKTKRHNVVPRHVIILRDTLFSILSFITVISSLVRPMKLVLSKHWYFYSNNHQRYFLSFSYITTLPLVLSLFL